MSEKTPLVTIQQNSGFIPTAVDATTATISWLDVGDYHLNESKFTYSLENLAQQAPPSISSDVRLLTGDNPLGDTLYPTGFIFQMHRCGSTLLAKALARSTRNVVINEGTTFHEGLWAYLTEGWQTDIHYGDEQVSLVRNLVLAMGRQRRTSYQAYFVKFQTWNVLFIDLISRAFPDVPCLFLYREPGEVFVSAWQKPAPILPKIKGKPAAAFLSKHSAAETAAMSDLAYHGQLYVQFLLAALNSQAPLLHHLNYDYLTEANFADILRYGFNYTPPADELEQMAQQFAYYAKDDSDSTPFVSDKATKQQAVTPEMTAFVAQYLADLYQQLETADNNLGPQLVGGKLG